MNKATITNETKAKEIYGSVMTGDYFIFTEMPAPIENDLLWHTDYTKNNETAKDILFMETKNYIICLNYGIAYNSFDLRDDLWDDYKMNVRDCPVKIVHPKITF